MRIEYFVISNLGAAVIVFLTIFSPPFKALLRAPGCSLEDAAPRQANVQDRGGFFFLLNFSFYLLFEDLIFFPIYYM